MRKIMKTTKYEIRKSLEEIPGIFLYMKNKSENFSHICSKRISKGEVYLRKNFVKKIKIIIIIEQGVFFFAFGILLLLIWQGLEQIFYGKITKSLFDTFVAITMLPTLWNMAEYLTLWINGIHFGPSEDYKKAFKLERISIVAYKLMGYLAIWIIEYKILFPKGNHENVLFVTYIIWSLFTICLWITSKYVIAKQDNPNFFQNAIESICTDVSEVIPNNSAKGSDENEDNHQFLPKRIYLIFKENDQCCYELYDPHNHDENFFGFQVNFYRFEFLKLNNTRKKLVLGLLNQALDTNTLDLHDLMLALKSYKIAYNLIFVPIPNMTSEEAINAYTTSFLPFYRDCLNAKLYRPIQ